MAMKKGVGRSKNISELRTRKHRGHCVEAKMSCELADSRRGTGTTGHTIILQVFSHSKACIQIQAASEHVFHGILSSSQAMAPHDNDEVLISVLSDNHADRIRSIPGLQSQDEEQLAALAILKLVKQLHVHLLVSDELEGPSEK
nr:hypothetical protein Iba_chr07fCG3890 [Ipomoea batatas]